MELAKPQALDSWRLGGIGILRAVFGIVWGIDARYKWQPSVWTPGGLDRDRRGPATGYRAGTLGKTDSITIK